jgi:hypothetical protein
VNGTSWYEITNAYFELADANSNYAGVAAQTGAMNFEVFEAGNGTLPTGSACGTNN